MAPPVLPSDFKAVIPDPTGSKCEAFVRALIRLPVLIYKLVSYFFDADGNFQVDFRRDLLGAGTYVFSAVELTLDGSILLCNGAAVSRTTYSALYAVLGDVYGAGDLSTTFNVPDFRDSFPIGQSAGKPGGSVGGEATHTLTIAELPAHNHDIELGVGTIGAGINQGSNFDATTTDGTSIKNAGSGTPFPMLPKYVSTFVYIRT